MEVDVFRLCLVLISNSIAGCTHLLNHFLDSQYFKKIDFHLLVESVLSFLQKYDPFPAHPFVKLRSQRARVRLRLQEIEIIISPN